MNGHRLDSTWLRAGKLLACIGIVMAQPSKAGDFRFRLRSLNRQGQPRFYIVNGINDVGQVVGTVLDPGIIFEGARWEPSTGRITYIPRWGTCSESVPWAINNLGHAAGGISLCPENYTNEGWWWYPGQPLTLLGDLPGGSNNMVVNAMNASDQVTGYSSSEAGTECILWDPVNGLVLISS